MSRDNRLRLNHAGVVRALGQTLSSRWTDGKMQALNALGNFVELTAADGHVFKAYVARPQGHFSDQPKGAVVVLQEIFGVNTHIREVADGYARAGYLAVAPATFSRVKADVDLGYNSQDRDEGFAYKKAVDALPAPGVMADIQAAVDHAHQELGAAQNKVGIVGYCWGGVLAWRAAALVKGLSAAVTYYGGGMTSPEEAARQSGVPVMSHFAEQDQHISLESVAAFAKAQPQVQVLTYPADHGFNCNHRAAWNEAAASQALTRTLAFFELHLA
jgi:carboxymethylenebutenolidase